MPVIQLHDQQHQLKQGQTRLGGGPDADVRVSDDASVGVQAVLELGSGDQVVIRRAGDAAAVKVNGVALGAEPTPLMHGDKVEIAGIELLFSDDRKAGATQYVSASEIAAMAAKRSGPARATAATGGRLVSLVDGKEYAIPDAGVTFGRDAGNDVVVAQNEVSRRHAGIAPAEGGYVLTDLSTNGVFVNGERVEGTKLLARADVIRIGSEEFRFYADVAPIARPTAPTPAPAPAAPVPAAPPAPAPPDTATPPAPAPRPSPPPLSKEPPTIPTQAPLAAAPAAAASAPDTRPVLGTLEFTGAGADSGKRVQIRGALTNIGRGEHNDVVLADDSVSDVHAKLLHRDDGWYLVDAGSTNGTYVGGARITTERRLDGSPDIRFGGVKVRFHPAESTGEPAKGTRRVSAVAPPRPAPPAPAKKSGVPAWVWIVLALVVVAGAVYFLKG
jgi:pSer/pThr/pTyr-binding forkhead associated (FHA) protein